MTSSGYPCPTDMRRRKPRSARAWLNSNFFIAWVIISVTTLAIQLCATLINVPDEVVRAGRLYSSMGTMEVTYVLSLTLLVIHPLELICQRRLGGLDRHHPVPAVPGGCCEWISAFTRVVASCTDPARNDQEQGERCERGSTLITVSAQCCPWLHCSDDGTEANKLRTFFRLMFALCAMILGYDGLTARKRVNTTR